MDRWENVHGIKQGPSGLDAMKLLGDVLSLGEKKFLSGMQVEGIMAKAGAPDPEFEVLFLQELITSSRKFPSALFGDDSGRMKVLTAMQEAVDSAVTREDEWLAQMDG
jgi:type III secretion protein W